MLNGSVYTKSFRVVKHKWLDSLPFQKLKSYVIVTNHGGNN